MTQQQLPVSYFSANTHRHVAHNAELNINNNFIKLPLLFYKPALKAPAFAMILLEYTACSVPIQVAISSYLFSVMLDIVQKYTDAG